MSATPTGADAMKEAEKARAAIEGFLANNPDGVFQIEAPDGDYVDVSAAVLRKLVEAQPAAVTGADFVEHTHPEYGPGYFATADVIAKLSGQPAAVAGEADWHQAGNIKADGTVDVFKPWVGYAKQKGVRIALYVNATAAESAAPAAPLVGEPPIDMLLFCPKCGMQHVDEPEYEADAKGRRYFASGWTNPPHRSHLCHACGCIWRPADVATNGVAKITTTGKADNWLAASPAAALVGEPCHALIDAADLYADNWPDGDSIPANEVRAAITNAFYAGWRRASPAAPAGVPTDLHAILEFLYGAEQFEGKWFGDLPPDGRTGRYWWRSVLRDAIKSAFKAGSVHRSDHSSSEASGSAIPARPTLPGEGDGLIARIDAAIKRIVDGQACMRIPAEQTDPDLVLAECKRALLAGGDQKALPPSSVQAVDGDEGASR